MCVEYFIANVDKIPVSMYYIYLASVGDTCKIFCCVSWKIVLDVLVDIITVFVSRNLLVISVHSLHFTKGINLSKFYEEINYFCRPNIWYIFEKL